MNISEKSIRDKEKELFAEWKKQIDEGSEGKFVPDGVVCETEYLKSKPKIVFILKEVNDPGGGGWDLRDFLRKGAKDGAQTWNNIARWTFGIANRNSMPHWVDFPEMSVDERAKILESICAMNLKKTPGGGSTDSEELETAARDDSDLIRRQYEIYEPDITICCGTEHLFKKSAGHGDQEWKETSRGVPWYERAANRYVIDFYHPAARIESSLMLYRLVDAVNEIMGNQCQS